MLQQFLKQPGKAEITSDILNQANVLSLGPLCDRMFCEAIGVEIMFLSVFLKVADASLFVSWTTVVPRPVFK